MMRWCNVPLSISSKRLVKIPDSEVVRLGAEFPEPGGRHPQERDPDPQADGISRCRNVLHMVVCSLRRITRKFRLIFKVVKNYNTGFPRYSRGLRSLKIFIREYQNPYFKPKTS
jgi:hypothetical protein